MIEVMLIGIGLAMDAVAVSISNGLKYKRLQKSDAIKIALTFGIFQGIMPMLGYFAGSVFSDKFAKYDHWIAFILLAIIGIKMLKEGFEKLSVEECDECELTMKDLLFQGIATSIDALAVGVSFVVLGTNILAASAIIALITFVLSLTAVTVGKRFGTILGQKAEILGGVILVGIGLKIFIEHVFL